MFKVDECVHYGSHGIFKIIEIVHKKLRNGTEKDCYVLEGIQVAKTRIVTPVDNNKIRYILSKKEIKELLAEVPSMELDCIDDTRKRSQEFKEVLLTGDNRKLLKIMKTINSENKEKISKGKNTSSGDQAFFEEAKKQFLEEIAYVLEISVEEASKYIQNALQNV